MTFMLDFADAPYRFFPARPSLLIMELGQMVNSHYLLPGRHHRVSKVEVDGAVDTVRKIAARGERMVFTPNHSTHSDPQVMSEVFRHLNNHSCFMAAYDVFLRSKVLGWIMQRSGAFSVDREGGDRKSMAEAIRVIKSGRFPLTIFPEGNVYLQNDRITPFNEGAFFLALKAQKELGDQRPVHVVPVAIKLSYVEDVRSTVIEKLQTISDITHENFRREENPVEELKRIGRDLLVRSLRQRGHLSPTEDFSGEKLSDALAAAAERIIEGLELKMELGAPKRGDLTDRVRRLRSAIHQVRIDADRGADHKVAALWSDEAMLALRILGYGEPYVAVNPTLDRFAETVERLNEDLFGNWDPPMGRRDALVRIGEPIALPEFLAESSAGATRKRAAVGDVTRAVEAAVQEGLDEINAGNERVGAQLL